MKEKKGKKGNKGNLGIWEIEKSQGKHIEIISVVTYFHLNFQCKKRRKKS